MRDGTAEVKYYDFFCVVFFFFAPLTLLFVFQLCVHHGELSLSQFTLKSRASSALARMAGGSDELLVTTVAQVQHLLSFAKTNSQDRKTLQDC